MTTHESVLNDEMAELLQDMRSERRAMPEQTDVLAEGGVVDIFVERYGVRPVVVETEFMPASSVENDAKKRLGKKKARKEKRLSLWWKSGSPENLRNLQVAFSGCSRPKCGPASAAKSRLGASELLAVPRAVVPLPATRLHAALGAIPRSRETPCAPACRTANP